MVAETIGFVLRNLPSHSVCDGARAFRLDERSRHSRRKAPCVGAAPANRDYRFVGWHFPRLVSGNGGSSYWMAGKSVPIRGGDGGFSHRRNSLRLILARPFIQGCGGLRGIDIPAGRCYRTHPRYGSRRQFRTGKRRLTILHGRHLPRARYNTAYYGNARTQRRLVET